MKREWTFLAITVLMPFLISLSAQIPNGGFEDWIVDGNDNNPADWNTTNFDPIVTVTPYTPAYAGNFSVKVSTFDAEILLPDLVVAGVASIEFPYTQRPSEINACIKATVMPGDKVFLIVSMYQGDSIIAFPTDCTFSIDTTISDFTCLTFPISYQSGILPDSASILIVAGSASAQVGTEIIVDELSFNNTPSTDQNMISANKSFVNHPNPAGNFTYIPVNLFNESDVEVVIWDIKGRLVDSQPFQLLEVGKHELFVNTNQLTNGIYLYSVRGKDFTVYGKMIIEK